MSESFAGERRAPGYAEKREKAGSTTGTVDFRWQSAPEVSSRAECERLNRDPRSKYEFRWVEK
jgi:hypothetical protein